ncbi:hypothetical protein [Pedobacter gandavensis]|uniref:hypothetical protein n=1 Tax=Pedobacter gandavensis TaxID=2679963 RepID=UPI0029304D6B|nr:hypothetical protein [Pedobacter gandavensis]
MDRKKKKNAAIKSAANVEHQRKALKERFLHRSKEIIKLIGGEAFLKGFPAIFLEKVYEHRYPGLKVKLAPDSDIEKFRLVQYNKLLLQFVETTEITFPNNNKVPLSWYLSEGMTLRDCLSELEPNGDPWLEEVKRNFAFSFHDGKFHHDLQELLIDLVTDISTYLSDYNGHIFRADLSFTPCFAQYHPENNIIIHTFKPEKEKVETNAGVRSAIRLGWISPEFKWQYFNVKPSKLGFKNTGLDVPLELYITTHALRRLQERINITPGIMHQILLHTFLEPQIGHRWKAELSHVDFLVSGHKVGYLVVKLHGSKLVVHTFLFLTNNDTFEGEKLGRLLSVVKEDKKYLEIDTLPAFNSYHIDENKELSQLFIDAGCESLLKLRHVQEFTVNQVADKDPESILQYLADAPYFTKKVNQPD